MKNLTRLEKASIAVITCALCILFYSVGAKAEPVQYDNWKQCKNAVKAVSGTTRVEGFAKTKWLTQQNQFTSKGFIWRNPSADSHTSNEWWLRAIEFYPPMHKKFPYALQAISTNHYFFGVEERRIQMTPKFNKRGWGQGMCFMAYSKNDGSQLQITIDDGVTLVFEEDFKREPMVFGFTGLFQKVVIEPVPKYDDNGNPEPTQHFWWMTRVLIGSER
jgi:hypothetical protein